MKNSDFPNKKAKVGQKIWLSRGESLKRISYISSKNQKIEKNQKIKKKSKNLKKIKKIWEKNQKSKKEIQQAEKIKKLGNRKIRKNLKTI